MTIFVERKIVTWSRATFNVKQEDLDKFLKKVSEGTEWEEEFGSNIDYDYISDVEEPYSPPSFGPHEDTLEVYDEYGNLILHE